MADGTIATTSQSEVMEALLLGHMVRLREGRARIAEQKEVMRAIKKEVKRDRDRKSVV